MGSSTDDLTARARIRDEAIRQFGEHGFARTSVRAIAAAAAVSPALVIHYFGSKNGLRAACDEHVLENTAVRALDTTRPERMRTTMTEYLRHPEQYLPEVAYIRQAVVDESDAGDTFFDALVDQTVGIVDEGIAAGMIRPVDDVRAVAVVLAANSMGVLTLRRHIARALGAPDDLMELVQRIGIPMMDLYTTALYTDASLLEATRAALREGKDAS